MSAELEARFERLLGVHQMRQRRVGTLWVLTCRCGQWGRDDLEFDEGSEEQQVLHFAHVAAVLAAAVAADTEARERRPFPVCTDPNCTIKRKPGFPMHGPHDFRAGKPASPRTSEPEEERQNLCPNCTADLTEHCGACGWTR